MARENEIEIRTEEKRMLICTAIVAKDGHIDIITRAGKKEDRITVERFLAQLFGRNVMITLL